MGSNGAHEIAHVNEAEGSETTIEIKLKTLDSQTYTLRVNKQMPVPELKEQIASVTGVLSEEQRLICRGRVLKDDQLLSAYHVEDGHTLHMVVGRPTPPSSGSLPSHSDPASDTSHGQRIQVAPGVVVETFDFPHLGDGIPPDISRIVSAVIGAFGVNSTVSGTEGTDIQSHDLGGQERWMAASGRAASALLQQGQAGMMSHSDVTHGAFGLPTSISVGPLQPHVIPDSLTTLSQYLSHMRQEFGATGRSNGHAAATGGTQTRESVSALPSLPVQDGIPTPQLLAEVLLSTRELLRDQTAECLLQLGTELQSQSAVTDSVARMSTQSNALRSGALLQNLGAFLLELGRTTMTLRMGQTSSEAVVNAGPALFISQAGPNPLMVQPLPFQPGTNFGAMATTAGDNGSGLVNESGAGFVPRRIDIQIRRGSSMARPNINQGEQVGSQQPLVLGNPVTSSGDQTPVNLATSAASEGLPRTSESGIRLVPRRTMVAAVPGSVDRLPALRRFHNVASRHLAGRGFRTLGDLQPSSPQTESQPVSQSEVQHNTGESSTDGVTVNAAPEQVPATSSRRFRFSVLSTDGTEHHQPSDGEVPVEVYQVLHSLFPGGEIHVQGAGTTEAATSPVPEAAGTSINTTDAAQNAETVSEEGIFLSNLLRQIMPLVSQPASSESPNVVQQNAAHESSEPPSALEQRADDDKLAEAGNSEGGTSCWHSDGQANPPNSKRQKME